MPTTCPANGIDADCDGGDAGGVAFVEQQGYETIQDAVSSAQDGDRVWVCPGEHTESIVVPDGRAVTLAGATGDAEAVVLDGGGMYRLIEAFGGDLELRDLTLRNGAAGSERGGAVYVQDVDLTLSRCIFATNTATEGGAVYFHPSEFGRSYTLAIQDTLFDGNIAEEAGGALGIEATQVAASVEIFTSRFTANTAGGTGGGADVLAQVETSVVVEGCTFEGNRSESAGGGLAIRGFAGLTNVSLGTTTFEDNSSFLGGGALDIDSLIERMDIVECTFTDNASDSSGGAILEAGDQLDELSIRDTTFTGNEAYGEGGAVSMSSEDNDRMVIFAGVTFEENQSASGGSALSCCEVGAASTDIEISDSAVLSNSFIYPLGDAAFELEGPVVLHSIDTDWGEGDTDNEGADVSSEGTEYSWDGTASFDCDAGTCE